MKTKLNFWLLYNTKAYQAFGANFSNSVAPNFAWARPIILNLMDKRKYLIRYSNSLLVFMIDKFSRKMSGKSWIGNNLNDCHLDYYYALLFVISALNFAVFLWVQRGYIYKKENTREVNVFEIVGAEQTEPQVGKAWTLLEFDTYKYHSRHGKNGNARCNSVTIYNSFAVI